MSEDRIGYGEPGRRRRKHGPSPSVGAVEMAAAVRWDSDRLALSQQLSTIRAYLAQLRLVRGALHMGLSAKLGQECQAARLVAQLARELDAARTMHAQLAASVPK